MSIIETVSFSRLDYYNMCPRAFQTKYVLKQGASLDKKEAPLIKGTLAHGILEEILKGKDAFDALVFALPLWLTGTCDLPIVNTAEELDLSKGIHIETLIYYVETVSNLLMRCHPDYQEEDAIRKKDGTPPADPLNHPPKEFTKEYVKLDVFLLEQRLDVTAQRLNTDFQTNAISLAKVAAEAYYLAKSFTYPEYFEETIGVELPLCEKSKEIYLAQDVYWNGLLDWVFKDKEGKITICDHKTDKALPTQTSVLQHDQLNLYASLYYELYDYWPDYIAINHLRSNTLVRVIPEPEISKNVYTYYREVLEQILDPGQKWLRKSPSRKYNSPCLKEIAGKITTCALLGKCWPHFKIDS